MNNYTIRWIQPGGKNWYGTDWAKKAIVDTKREIYALIPTLMSGDVPEDFTGSYIRGQGYLDIDSLEIFSNMTFCVVQGHNEWMILTGFEVDIS